MYRSMRCAALKWDCQGSAANWLMIPIAEAMSGLVETIKYMRLPTIDRKWVASAGLSAFSDISPSEGAWQSLMDGSRGVATGWHSDIPNRSSIWAAKCSWWSEIVRRGRSRSTDIPKKCDTSPQSDISKREVNFPLRDNIIVGFFVRINRSSTYSARIEKSGLFGVPRM